MNTLTILTLAQLDFWRNRFNLNGKENCPLLMLWELRTSDCGSLESLYNTYVQNFSLSLVLFIFVVSLIMWKFWEFLAEHDSGIILTCVYCFSLGYCQSFAYHLHRWQSCEYWNITTLVSALNFDCVYQLECEFYWADNSVSSKPEKATEPASALVPFLQKFAEPRNKKPSVSIFSTNVFKITVLK